MQAAIECVVYAIDTRENDPAPLFNGRFEARDKSAHFDQLGILRHRTIALIQSAFATTDQSDQHPLGSEVLRGNDIAIFWILRAKHWLTSVPGVAL